MDRPEDENHGKGGGVKGLKSANYNVYSANNVFFICIHIPKSDVVTYNIYIP